MSTAIIGGGLSGTLLAYYMLQADVVPATVYLFEKEYQQLSRGIAYRSSTDGQLLNVPADKMDVYGKPAGSFYQWLIKKIPGDHKPDDFVPRSWFGTYLKEIFHDALDSAKFTTLRVITDEVVDLIKDEDTIRVITAGNHEYVVSHAVLANGILSPADPFPLTMEVNLSGLYQANPWNFNYQQQLKPNDHIVLVGTGLTMLDHALCLLKSDKQLSLTAFSRRGLLPLPHAPYAPYNFPDYNIVPCEDIGVLLEQIRTYYRKHQPNGLDWRCLIDRIRQQVPELWKALNASSKSRFIRHVKPYWEIHRHRAPQQTLAVIQEATAAGRFTLLKGYAHKVQCSEDGTLAITIVQGREQYVCQANYMLNSSGLQRDIFLTADSLLKKLIQRGYMLPDMLGLGVETLETGALRGTDEGKNIFVLGALRRAAVFECTAAKEIGEQAFSLHQHVLSLFQEKPVK